MNIMIKAPKIIVLDACSMCQLNCPLCDTLERRNKPSLIGWGYLKFKNFKKLVDDNLYIEYIELSNTGEIFLNPELKHIIKYAYEKNMILAGSGVNFNNISEEMIKCLVKYQFERLTVSIDGASNKTYQIYRRGGNFKQVIKNILSINHYKRKYNSKFPILTWQFIVFSHNEHELSKAKYLARRLGMKFEIKLSWDPSYSPVKNKELVRKETGLGVASRKEFQEKYKRYYIDVCIQFWRSPVINWDGKLFGCCKNCYSDFGNVFESGLTKCLESEKYLYAKEMILRRKKPRDDIACTHCYLYQQPLNSPALNHMEKKQ